MLARGLGYDTVFVDLTDREADYSGIELGPGDMALVAMPCFAGHAPAVALDRFERVAGNGAPCVPVCVYGNRAFDSALREIADVAEAAGFTVVAGVAGVVQNSIAPQYGTGRPNDADEGRLIGFGRRIGEMLRGAQAIEGKAIPGTSPRRRVAPPPVVPRYAGSCSRCGACASSCPTGAIDPATLRADGKQCCACLRCVYVCPDKARAVNPLLQKAVATFIKKAATSPKESELFSA